jgi:ADP-heptose:LPS heptosyltransferase
MARLPSLVRPVRRRVRQMLRGFLLLIERPREFLSALMLIARYAYNVQIKRRLLVVVCRPGGVGDLVCLLGSLRGLRARYPNSWLVLICPLGCSALAAASGLCDVASDAHSIFHRFVKSECPPSRYYYPRLPDECTPPRPRRLHLAEEFAAILQVHVDFSSVSFTVPAKTGRRVAQSLRKINPLQLPLIVMHAGPAWPVREWPLGRWAELSEKIGSRTSAIIIQIGTDLEAGRQLIRRLRIPHTVDWVNKLDLVELVALLELANVFVGIDSGPAHIAGTIGVPSIGLFGPTVAPLFLHPQASTKVITGSSKCIGCHHSLTGPIHWRIGCPNDIACMEEITAEQVLGAVLECLVEADTRSKRHKGRRTCVV